MSPPDSTSRANKQAAGWSPLLLLNWLSAVAATTICVRQQERSRGRLRQQNKISPPSVRENTLEFQGRPCYFCKCRILKPLKYTHTYTLHTTQTSAATDVIVNHQKPKVLVNIPNQTTTYVERTHQPAVVRRALIGQTQKYGWLKKRREEESFRNHWNRFSLQVFYRDIKASFWISQDRRGSIFIPYSSPGSFWGLIPAITGREARIPDLHDTHTHTMWGNWSQHTQKAEALSFIHKRFRKKYEN